MATLQLSMNEMALAKACADGDYQAQKRLYDLYAPQMMGVALRYSSGKADAEDILQDGFVTIYRNIHTYSGAGPLGGWMRRVIINTALQRYRQHKHLQLVHMDAEVLNQEVSDDVLSAMRTEELLLKIQLLPAGFRTVFNLYAIEGYKHHEIAELLGISEGTSKSQYSRSRALLREMIENEEMEGEKRAGK